MDPVTELPMEQITVDINPMDDEGNKIEPEAVRKLVPRQKLRHRVRYTYHCVMCDFKTENYKVFVYHLIKKNPCIETVTSTEIFKRHARTFLQKYKESMEYLKLEDLPLLEKIKEYKSIKLQATKIRNMTNKLPPDFPKAVIDSIHELYDTIIKMEGYD